MSQQRVVDASPADVWAVLADGWLYPVFVVGAARMRAVDRTWPAPGARLHHSAGTWPLVLDDTTSVTACEPERRLELTARGWPAGQARITVELAPHPGGGTLVTMAEDASAGPGLAVPGPLRRALVDWRNAETLQRLAWLAEGRAAAHRGGSG
jgi:uncharacterized protein YndB with AHSA1/START domain